jgi:hypothetical protein
MEYKNHRDRDVLWVSAYQWVVSIIVVYLAYTYKKKTDETRWAF